MRLSLQGGGAQKVVAGGLWYSISPDGKLLAISVWERSAQLPSGGSWQLQIFSMETLQKIQSIPSNSVSAGIAFSPDSKSVFYSSQPGWDATIWRQPLDAGAPVKVVVFPGKSVRWIRLSPDGTKLGLTIATPQSEAVLIRDIR
jgi:Tol biopolymer transport system component